MENMINIIEKTKIDFYQYIQTIFSKNNMLEEIVITLSKSHIIEKGKKINELSVVRVESIKLNTPNQFIIYFPLIDQFSVKSSTILNFLFQFINFSHIINLEFKDVIYRINNEITQHELFHTELNTYINQEEQKNETWRFKRKELENNKYSFFGELLNKKLEFLDYQHKLSLHKPFIKSTLKLKI